MSRNIRQLMVLASLIGGVAAFIGFYIAYRWDLPVGPTDVVLLGVVYAAAWIVSMLLPASLRHLHTA